jgi:hypothetical protein
MLPLRIRLFHGLLPCQQAHWPIVQSAAASMIFTGRAGDTSRGALCEWVRGRGERAGAALAGKYGPGRGKGKGGITSLPAVLHLRRGLRPAAHCMALAVDASIHRVSEILSFAASLALCQHEQRRQMGNATRARACRSALQNYATRLSPVVRHH